MLLNKYRVKTYKFNEFRKEELTVTEEILSQIKKNKIMYARLVLTTALMLHFNMNFVFAGNISNSLDSTFGLLVELLMQFAKWGCWGLGLKKTIEEMLAGANFKQASTSGIQYWLAYLFIQFYPQLFDLFSGIKF